MGEQHWPCSILTGRLQDKSYNYILASFTLNCQDGQKEGIRKEEGPKGSLQRLLAVQSDTNPGVQGSFQHDRPEQRWLHQRRRSWRYVLIDGKGPTSDLLGRHDQRSVS